MVNKAAFRVLENIKCIIFAYFWLWEHFIWVHVAVKSVELFLAVPSSHVIMLIWLQVVLFPVKFPADETTRAAESSLDTWLPATHMGSCMEACPHPLQTY